MSSSDSADELHCSSFQLLIWFHFVVKSFEGFIVMPTTLSHSGNYSVSCLLVFISMFECVYVLKLGFDPGLWSVICLCLVAMIHPVTQVNVSKEHRKRTQKYFYLYIYVSTPGYMEVFVCAFVVVEWDCYLWLMFLFHSWSHKAQRALLWCQKQRGEEIKTEEKTGGEQGERRSWWSRYSLSAACWVKKKHSREYSGCFVCLVALFQSVI